MLHGKAKLNDLLFKDDFQSVVHSFSTLYIVYKHYKFPLNGMPINVIRLSLRPFKLFFQQLH